MKVVIQRVSQAQVKINNQTVGRIGRGLVVLVAVGKNDTAANAKKLAQKICVLRIFSDAAGKMNLSVADIKGEVLVVSQFTLYGDCRRGQRPEFTAAAAPQIAEPFYRQFIDYLKSSGLKVADGRFGALMTVELTNDGPVTIIMEI